MSFHSPTLNTSYLVLCHCCKDQITLTYIESRISIVQVSIVIFFGNPQRSIAISLLVFIACASTAGRDIENYNDLCDECKQYNSSYRFRGWFCWTVCGKQQPTTKPNVENVTRKTHAIKTTTKRTKDTIEQNNRTVEDGNSPYTLGYYLSDKYRQVLVESSKLLEVFEKARCLIPKDIDSITRALLLQQCFSRNHAHGNETVCYEELGCFPMESPWVSFFRPFPTPHTPDQIDVKIFLYTGNEEEAFEVPLWPKINLKGSNFDPNRSKTVFITHGFASNGNSSWMHKMKDAYLENVDANVFIVDWGEGASHFNYLQVASNTRIVGAELGRFGKYLLSQGVDPKSLHLIGHSLGSHISGYMSKNMADIAIPGRITALDPAQPGFETESDEVRLNKQDAEFVDVLHTDAKPFIPFIGFGMLRPIGHVDFYVNGGSNQPGCFSNTNVGKAKSIYDLADIPVEVISKWVSCSHGRAYHVFTASLYQEPHCLWARKIPFVANLIKVTTMGALRLFDPFVETWDSCTKELCTTVGLITPDLEARGIFSLSTTGGTPFCVTDEERDKKVKDILSLGLFSLGNKIKEKFLSWFT